MRLVIILTAMMICPIALAAEVQIESWEKQALQDIKALRCRKLRVLVLDQAQQPVPHVKVRIQQRRHAMPLGLAVSQSQLPLDILAGQKMSAPLFRIFNSVSLGDTGRWDQIEPEMGLADWGKIRYWLDWSHEQGLSVRYGSVFSANPDQQANWVALLGRRDLMAGIELHQRQIMRKFSGQIIAFDLYSHVLGHQFIEDQLSNVMVRRMYEQATALAPQIPMAIAMDNVLAPQHVQKAVKRVGLLKRAFVPINQWAIGIHVPLNVDPRILKRGLDWLASLEIPLVVNKLTFAVGPKEQVKKSVHTALTVLFAHPRVTGIYIAIPQTEGLNAQIMMPLIDQQGQATEVGQWVDNHFTEQWITTGSLITDELGNVQGQVFAGLYDIQATLPDGQNAYTSVFINQDEQRKTVVISPLAKSLEPGQ